MEGHLEWTLWVMPQHQPGVEVPVSWDSASDWGIPTLCSNPGFAGSFVCLQDQMDFRHIWHQTRVSSSDVDKETSVTLQSFMTKPVTTSDTVIYWLNYPLGFLPPFQHGHNVNFSLVKSCNENYNINVTTNPAYNHSPQQTQKEQKVSTKSFNWWYWCTYW